MSKSTASSSSSSDSPLYGCVVIGGGLSGLSAAAYLQDNGLSSLLVLEARDRVGGRTHTLHLESGHYLDLGGAYVGPSQTRILRVAHELGVKTEEIYDEGKGVMLAKQQRTAYSTALPYLGPWATLDLNSALAKTERQRQLVDVSEPWKDASREGTLDGLTTEQFIVSISDTEMAREMYRAVVRIILCVEPCEVSAQYWLMYVQAGQGMDRLMASTGGGQERHFKGGSQQVSLKLREKIGLARVLLNKPVVAITWDEAKTTAGRKEADDVNAGVDPTSIPPSASVLITCRDGSTYRAQRVIVALSPALYSTIRFEPYFPRSKAPLQRFFMGAVIKTVTRYARPFWREAGYKGITCDLPHYAFSTQPANDSSQPRPRPVGYSLDDCHDEPGPDGQPYYAIVGFIVGQTCRLYAALPLAERRQAVLQQYKEAFQLDDALQPIGYYEKDWTQEEFSKGCYGAVPGPGVVGAVGPAWRQPVAGVEFAGTELAQSWPGYMNGAVESGERAAHSVLQSLNIVKAPFIWEEPHRKEWEVKDRSPPPDPAQWLLPSPRVAQFSIAAAVAVAAGAAYWMRLGGGL